MMPEVNPELELLVGLQSVKSFNDFVNDLLALSANQRVFDFLGTHTVLPK